jgi:Tfp pilus assembly protein PilO
MSVFLAQVLAFIRRLPVAAACLALAVVLAAYNWHLWHERAAVAARHEEVRGLGTAMLAFLTDRARIEADRAALREALDFIEANLVDEEGMEANLGYFYRLERLTRVRLARIDQLAPSLPEPGSPYKAVPVTLQISGSYRSIMSFLRELETGPRLLRVRNYRFERVDPGSGELILFLTVDLLARL